MPKTMPLTPAVAADVVRLARERFDRTSFAGCCPYAEARRVVLDATAGLRAAEIAGVALAVTGVRCRGKRDGLRELVAFVTETHRRRDSQRV